MSGPSRRNGRAEQQLVVLLDLALRNPCRTFTEQGLLLEACREANELAMGFRDFEVEAAESWRSKPCCDCGDPLATTYGGDRCAACSTDHWIDCAADAADEAATAEEAHA